VVEELRALLRDRGLEPPYVLVGHSLGGLYLQAYARRYPDEVKALVLVDSTHPRQMQGAGAPENWPWWVRRAIFGLLPKAGKAELAAVNTTGEQVLSLPPLPGNRVMVLSALKPMKDTSALGRDANAKRVDLARLYPGAHQVWVESGHGIPLEKPEAVIEAVRQVLAGP
jgi:pimeloyl-ACP methyl ester carboxylesterase